MFSIISDSISMIPQSECMGIAYMHMLYIHLTMLTCGYIYRVGLCRVYIMYNRAGFLFNGCIAVDFKLCMIYT